MAPDESPQQEPSSFMPSNTPWNSNITSGNYPYYPSYPNQYVAPIMAPGPITYPLYIGTTESPLTEERIRQIFREELSAYFDEGNDVLSAPSFPEDDTQS